MGFVIGEEEIDVHRLPLNWSCWLRGNADVQRGALRRWQLLFYLGPATLSVIKTGPTTCYCLVETCQSQRFPLGVIWKSLWNVDAENQPEKMFWGTWVMWGACRASPTGEVKMKFLEKLDKGVCVLVWQENLVKDSLKFSLCLIRINLNFLFWGKAQVVFLGGQK